jgi:hypothetical protein
MCAVPFPRSERGCLRRTQNCCPLLPARQTPAESPRARAPCGLRSFLPEPEWRTAYEWLPRDVAQPTRSLRRRPPAPARRRARAGAELGEALPPRAQRRSSRFRRARSEQRTDLVPTGSAVPGSSPGSAAQCAREREKPDDRDRTTPAGRPSRPQSWFRRECRGGRRAHRKAFRRARRRTRRCRCEDRLPCPVPAPAPCSSPCP